MAGGYRNPALLTADPGASLRRRPLDSESPRSRPDWLWCRLLLADTAPMDDRTRIQRLMPLMREFGGLERKRVGEGVTPLEYQRCLDLKTQIGRSLLAPGEARRAGRPEPRTGERTTRLAIRYKTRDALIASIVENIQPAGFFVPTPFAAEVGTRFLVRITLAAESETGEFPCIVVTSMTQGAHTLSTASMGMGLKIERTNPTQSDDVAKLFGGALDPKLARTG